jgi:hypothetical protein
LEDCRKGLRSSHPPPGSSNTGKALAATSLEWPG